MSIFLAVSEHDVHIVPQRGGRSVAVAVNQAVNRRPRLRRSPFASFYSAPEQMILFRIVVDAATSGLPIRI
jgi:hypothetical protein